MARRVENLEAWFVWGEQEPGVGTAAMFALRVLVSLERLGLDLGGEGM